MLNSANWTYLSHRHCENCKCSMSMSIELFVFCAILLSATRFLHLQFKVESKVLVYSNSCSLALSWELAAIIAEFHSATKSFNLDVSFLNFSWSRVTVASGQTISKVGKRETKSKTIRGGVGIGLLRFDHCSLYVTFVSWACDVQCHAWVETFVFAVLFFIRPKSYHALLSFSVLVGNVMLVSLDVGWCFLLQNCNKNRESLIVDQIKSSRSKNLPKIKQTFLTMMRYMAFQSAE